MLTARAAGTVGVDADFLHVDLKVLIAFQNGGHVQRTEGGVAAGIGVEGRNAHQTVNAPLTAQETVGVFTLHLEGHAFQARFVAFQNVVDRHLEAVAFAVAGVHPV